MSTPSIQQPKYLQIAEDLDAQMLRGVYKPGDALPTKPVLMESYGAALGTVDKALAHLRNKGLIETAQGRGTFVLERPVPPESLEERFTALQQRVERQEMQLAELRQQMATLEAQINEVRSNQGLPDHSNGSSIEEAG